MMRQKVMLPILTMALLTLGAMDANAVGEGKQCGGIGGIRCDRGLWCDPEPGKCGVKDVGGICVKVPRGCPKNIEHVCGCNKKTYSNDCVRQQSRVAKDYDGRCKK